jgi:hypothetical protein
MAKVIINNMTSDTMALDVTLGASIVRRNIIAGGSVDIGDVATIEEVNQNPFIKQMIADSKLRVSSLADPSDIAEGTKLIVSSYLLAPALADVAGVVASADWANATPTIVAQPDVPRNVTATLTDVNNSCRGLLTVTGTDLAGRVVTETMQPDGAGGGKTLTGTKIFAAVTSVALTGCTGGTPSTDVFVVGYGNVIGLPSDIQSATAVKSVKLGGAVVTPVVKTGVSSSGVDASAGTYDGAKALVVAYNVGE